MRVRKYELTDFKQIQKWGEEWGSEYRQELFPGTGFIIDGVGAYFLYSTDSNVCWLENMITRKGLDPMARGRGIDLLIEAAFKEAQAMGFEVAYASTSLTSAAKRAKEHGARITPNHFLLTKNLKNHSQLQ